MTAKDSRPADPLRQLLEVCDRLDASRDELERARSEAARSRLRTQKQRLRAQLEALVGEDDAPEVLRVAFAEGEPGEGLNVAERTLLAVLLHRRIGTADYWISGRDLLWIVAESTFELFESRRYLAPESRLVASGAMSVLRDADDDADDLLNHHYVLAPSLYREICRRHGLPETAAGASGPPFADGTDYLLGLGDVSQACQLRAAKAFEYGYWREIHGEPYETESVLAQRVDHTLGEVRRRLATSPDAEHFELVQLRSRFGLEPAELVIVVTLLLQETLVGCPIIEAIDLLRLVSRTPRDLLRKRRLLAPASPLIREEIVHLEDLHADRALTGHAYLSKWVTDELLDETFRVDRAIASDERIGFHNYLSRLHGSDDFFEKL